MKPLSGQKQVVKTGAQQIECVPWGGRPGRPPCLCSSGQPWAVPLPPALPEDEEEAGQSSEHSVGAKHWWLILSRDLYAKKKSARWKYGAEYSRQKEWQGQRPWGRNKHGILEEQERPLQLNTEHREDNSAQSQQRAKETKGGETSIADKVNTGVELRFLAEQLRSRWYL